MLHSDTQAVGLAILFLTLDVLVFCLVYLASLALVMRWTVRPSCSARAWRWRAAVTDRGGRGREAKPEPIRPATP